MSAGDPFAYRVLLLAAGFTLAAASAVAAPQYPPRRPEIFVPPPLVALTNLDLGVPREPVASPFAVDVTTAVELLDAAPRVQPVGPDPLDLAGATLGEEGRAIAAELADWAAQKAGISAERRAVRAALAETYAARGFRPFWIESGQWRAAAEPALTRLAKAGDDALNLRAYAMPSAEKAAPSVKDEFALSESVAAYALQARGARIDPERLSPLIGAQTTLPEPGRAVAEVAAAGSRAGETLQDYNPPHYGYQQLRDKLIDMRAQRVGSPASDQRLAEAASLDAQSDALAPARRKRSRVESPALALSRMEAEIIANMERWRWLPRDMGDPRIEVNIPDFELALVRDGQIAHRARVIVGKEQTPTPVFSDAMEEIVVNPSWYVPKSIVEKEWGGAVGAGYNVTYRHGKMVVRQPPGERNALGRVKFLFPNDYAVYMHDTPSRGLFNASYRAFSHGCMRVQDPFLLAEAVLGPNSGWTEAKVRRLIGASERYINLPKPMPVHIEYFTLYVDEAGQLVQRPDLYGYSARVRRALGLAG